MKKSISYKEEIKTVLAIFMFNLIVKKLSQSNFSPSTRKTDTFGEHLEWEKFICLSFTPGKGT